jgi:hypothetical protein
MALAITPTTSNVEKSLENKDTTNRILLVFEKTIQLDELSMVDNKRQDSQKKEDVISIEYPLIRINDYILNRAEIRNFTIDCTEFLPKVTLNALFLDHLFIAKEMPKDGDIISVMIRSKNNILKNIRNDYVITSVYVAPNLTGFKNAVEMTFYGELFIPGLKSQKNDFSFKGTSLEAAKDFAQKFGLGFASNEDNTNDKQIWLKANISGDIYINNIIERAWRDKKSFYNCWIDLYYNLNFVNLDKQLMSSETETDIATVISNIDKNWTYGSNVEEKNAVPTIKLFSNWLNFRTSSFYINSWRPINRSSQITFKIGTKMTCEMFEHNKNIYENVKTDKNKNYWAVTVEPTYDENKANKTILLRGRTPFDASTNKTDLARANYSYIDLYEKYPWLGIQYTISNPDEDNSRWDGNHHQNYQVARVQNLINNKELDKLNLHVEVNGNNFNIIRGDKMPVILIRFDAIDNKKIHPESKYTGDMLDLFYSGWYLVKGFIVNWKNSEKGSLMSDFIQEFILTRREWPTPVPIEPVKSTDVKK